MVLPRSVDPSTVAHYTCHRSPRPVPIDGTLSDPVWRAAPRSPRFVDMVSGEPGWFDTRAAAVWDDEHLHIAFWCDEPFPEAHVTERDGIVFAENDVEVFIDGGDCYYELELNAANTIYEVFFIWQDAYAKGSRFDVPEFDLVQQRALSFAGNEDRAVPSFWRGTHPRGPRWAFCHWDLPGLRTAVHVDGTLNDRQVVSRGWTAHLALPWAGLGWLANGRAIPPAEGDTWRLFFGRFEKLTTGGIEVEPHPAWCWNRHGVLDTHLPEQWTTVTFSRREP
jgi:hypothetical protein